MSTAVVLILMIAGAGLAGYRVARASRNRRSSVALRVLPAPPESLGDVGARPDWRRFAEGREPGAAADPDDFWLTLGVAATEFDETGAATSYRLFTDLLACGPYPAHVVAALTLAQSPQLPRFLRDLELRNEIGEIAAYSLRHVRTEADRAVICELVGQAASFAGRHADALKVWMFPLDRDLDSDDLGTQTRAVYGLERFGTDAHRARVDELIQTKTGDPEIRDRLIAARDVARRDASAESPPALRPDSSLIEPSSPARPIFYAEALSSGGLDLPQAATE
jgi:hypothetical protein